ncbi:MAG: cell surface protein SprA [Sphingobacteriales bacterium]|nr:MAG: cell surface protein SprA [Sphingobacteriales bacterium]
MLSPEDTSKNPGDTIKLPYRIPEKGKGNIDLFTPPAVEEKVELDSTLQYYKRSRSVGGQSIEDDEYMPFDEYVEDQNKKWIQEYFKDRSQAQNSVQGRTILPNVDLGVGALDNLFNGKVEVRPQGSAEVSFSQDWNRVQNPTWSLREQRNSQFKFDQKIQVNVIGSIGDKFKMNINYDTEASFDFENQRKLNWDGKEDDIIKSIEVGDISMPVSGSLITGSQSLFGFKTKLQFGKLDVTGVFSQQKSEKKSITLENGAQKNNFNISADNYDANRHFFLAQYFRDHYNEYNRNWPSLSNIIVTRVEVWVTNATIKPQDTRSVAAFMDLGEKNYFSKGGFIAPEPGGPDVPDNNSNNLFKKLTANSRFREEKYISQELDVQGRPLGFNNTQDYYVLSNARQLSQNDYSYNPKLGYISLNQTLNPDDVLAVAYEYTINGRKYQVGEFARDISPDANNTNVIFLKMLKSVNIRPNLPIWDLMMKNVYSLGAYQVQSQDFRLQVVYADDQGADLNYIPEADELNLNGKPLIRVLNLDRYNTQQEPKPDGNFDYLEGVTINSNNGRIMFPVLEPFGKDLATKFSDPGRAEKYTYQALYDSTRAAAQQQAQKNKFFLRGSYQGASGAEISLNSINVQPGSVKVYADGAPLVEGAQYTVDYNMGRVRITDNSVLNSGAVIKVESESNTLFSIQQKTLMGTRLDYHISKDFTVGGTFLYLRERPLTKKINIGDEPIRNAIYGFDGSYRTDSRLITKLVDRIPLIATKEKSEVALQGEFAQILPGHPKTLNNGLDKGGVSYLDDFEGSQIPYDLRLGNNWVLSSAPQGVANIPEASLVNDLSYGYKRAKLSWYLIDNIFYSNDQNTPKNIRGNEAILSNHYMRSVRETEVFQNKQIPNNVPGLLQTFDVIYRPMERGPYNFTVNGLDPNGNLADPRSSWAGITRRIETNDFEAANIEYLTFWVMDPFKYNPNGNGGEMYINIGNISEDILRDNRKSYENGLPKDGDTTQVDTTAWGYVPNGIQVTTAFDNDPTARPNQDVGFDGLTDDREREFYKNYLNSLPQNVRDKFLTDPAGDNFHFFRGDDLDNSAADILERYRNFNNPQGNTPSSIGANNGYGSLSPDDEDINRDFNIDKVEDYFEYKINIKPGDLVVGKNFVTDKQKAIVDLAGNKQDSIYWYQLKVPIRQYSRRVGTIQDFKSIRFMRMYFTGFDDTLKMRFAQLQFVRGDWRKYLYSLEAPGDAPVTNPDDATKFEVTTVNLEENGLRPNIPYVLPPGILRETDVTTPNLVQQNEQSLSLQVCNLRDGDARAVFKNTTFDVRQYKHLRMFVHAESRDEAVKDKDLSVFVRIGADFSNNYYEYEMPLKVTRNGSSARDEVWPSENNLDILLKDLYTAKEERQKAGASMLIPFTAIPNSSGGIIRVMGNPDLSNIRTIMIGVKNPLGGNLTNMTSCADVWVNELRVAEFDEHGGWAAITRATVKLADFGRLELNGSRRTIGFGGIEQSLQERSQQDMRTYGIITSFELGKFFPQKLNLRIPMYFAYSEQINRPRYNPLSPDLPLASLADLYSEDQSKQDSVLKAAEDFTARKSLNFTNVQKQRPSNSRRKQQLYDIENFNATYIYNEIYRRNINNVYDFEKQYTGRLGYTYGFNAKPVQPFKKITNKNLKAISDFNFYYLPQSISVQGEINRRYAERLYRNTDNIKTIIEPQYDKNFTLDRVYDMKYNLTKALRLSYSAKGQSRIQEPYGEIDTKEERDTIKRELMQFGNLNAFQQATQLAYDVPINKLPYLDFVTLQTSYTGNYEWKTAPPAALQLGNTIQNSQTISIVNNMDMRTLYNKNKFLRNIVQGRGNASSTPKPNLKTGTVAGNEIKEQPSNGLSIGESMVGLLLSVRTISLNYTLNDGTLLPGFKPIPQVIGQDFRSEGPGLPFVFGSQQDIRPKAVQNGWLTTDTNLTTPFVQTHRENITGRAKLEPIKNLTINVDFNKQVIRSFQENFRNVSPDPSLVDIQHLGPVTTGSFSMSYLALSTAFIRDGKDHSSATFQQFQANRFEVSKELSKSNPVSGERIDSTGYYAGYGKYSQDVLIPAFLAAYSGRSVNASRLSAFPRMPAPNWNIQYTGLSNIKAIKSFAKSVNLSHGYRSTYNVDNYMTSLAYDPNAVISQGKDLESEFRIERITIQERFEPLLGVDINWANNWTSRVEYKKDRTLALSFTDRKLTEVRGEDFVIGIGYRTSRLLLPFKVKRKKAYLDQDLTFRFDMSIRDNKQVVRILDQERTEPTGGQRIINLTPNITYALSKTLTLNVFFKRNVNKPYTSNLYPTAFTSVGFSLRYILAP